MKKTRKPRNEVSIGLDLLKPIDLTVVGTADDPCFGKLHDSTHSACKACGDSDICLIVCGQLNHVKRAKEEETSTLLNTPNSKTTWQDLGRYIRKRLKKKGSMGLQFMKDSACANFKISEDRYDKLLRIYLKKTKYVKKKGDELTHKKLS